MDNKLKANRPVLFKICINSVDQEKLYAHKFQGKPVKILDLKKSEKAKLPEKRNIETILKFKNGPTSKTIIEKNKLKNSGIRIRANGIKILKFSSKVKELVIQYIPLK